jgi:hypothetical protein
LRRWDAVSGGGCRMVIRVWVWKFNLRAHSWCRLKSIKEILQSGAKWRKVVQTTAKLGMKMRTSGVTLHRHRTTEPTPKPQKSSDSRERGFEFVNHMILSLVAEVHSLG